VESTIEKSWHIDTGDSVFETDAETLKQWIWEGAVLPHHRVSRGGLRWLEAARVPQFAEHFATAREMNELLGNPIPPVNSVSPPASRGVARAMPVTPAFDDRYTLPSDVAKASSTPFGLRLAVSSAIALVLAIFGGYLWGYHISSPREFAALKNEPKIAALQSKLDKDKSLIEESRNARPSVSLDARMATVSSGPKLGTAKTGDIAERKSGIPKFNMPEYTPPTMPDFSALIPKRDYDGELKNLDAQFETDKNKIVAEIRAADSKARVLPASALLFIGLFGLNFARLKFTSKK
jgi:hypothetical protein